jgi:signal peptide peptidase SppA
MKQYPHVTAAVFQRAWAILPSTLAVIVNMVRFRNAGGVLTADEIRERVGAAPQRASASSRAGAVAVIPLQGVIMYRAGMMAQTSGAVSLESFMADFRAAMADEEIGSIVLDIDSPGGEVSGVPEAAAEIRAARDQKRIVAVANPMAASAAYWIGSQAGEFYCMPSGWVGSIGCYSAHDDLSAMYEMEGVSETLISAGKYKVEASELAPLSDEARAYIQSIVDDYYGMFVADVAKGRGVPAADVRGGMGQGRMLLAKPAVAERMIDGVATLDEAIRKALGPVRKTAAFQRLDVDALAPAVVEIDGSADLFAVGATAIAIHHTETDESPWDGPAEEAKIPGDATASTLRQMYAWQDPQANEDTKAAYKFIHHHWRGGPGAANTRACRSGIGTLNGARDGTTIPSSDRQGVYDHLAAHLRDAGQVPTDLRGEEEGEPVLAGVPGLDYYALRARRHKRGGSR